MKVVFFHFYFIVLVHLVVIEPCVVAIISDSKLISVFCSFSEFFLD
ncbi:putative signal peptide protein [Puccinia sorghi]|uniref:Putative signal peptide protein n=1 Tax=Puccinia sorghi TaxID=27349 RepID=A0A0L6U6Q0_9BASI|nr:putative signal peptide protein [Puccinia sorghi]